MQTSPVIRVITIQNKQGLHARPAQQFVQLASQYESKIQLVRDGRRVEARNMIDLLTLGATQGTQLTLEADGPDAQAAVDALANLVETGFLQEDAEID
jgi:phosphocarrier protein